MPAYRAGRFVLNFCLFIKRYIKECGEQKRCTQTFQKKYSHLKIKNLNN